MKQKKHRLLAALGTTPALLAPVAVHAAVPSPAVAVPADAWQQRLWNFHHEQLLGTSVQLTVRAASQADARRAEAAALAAMDGDEARLSAWRAQSEFSRWQRTRFAAVPVSEELFSVLSGFDQWRARTHGALDPSVEAATRLWQRAASEGRRPSDREIAETLEAIQQPHWALDYEHRTATRLSDTPLALASFVKSWIVARAADAALASGASGVLINAGGDVVARGAMTQIVEIADPATAADNASSIDAVVVHDRAVATSGGARRGFQIAQAAAVQSPEFSHLIDPATARPVGHVLSSTVIARDAATAGALATAFAVMPVETSRALAATVPGVDYMLLLADGARVASPGWSSYSVGGKPQLTPAAATKTKPAAGLWNPHFELAIEVNLPQMHDARYRRPYVAVWVEDGDHYPVRTLALWTENPRWLPDLKRWYHDDQIRGMSEGGDISRTVGSATRPAGKYSLLWDGKDNQGKPVKAGAYTICIEASREHGGYQLQQQQINFNGQPQHMQLPAGQELGSILLDYRKH